MEKRERRERYRRHQRGGGGGGSGGDKQAPSDLAAPAGAAAAAPSPAPVIQEKKVIDHTAIPDPHMFDNLKRETEEIAALQPKKYSKRQVFSNWAKYEGGQQEEEEPWGRAEGEAGVGEKFETLLRGAQMGSQLQLKSERSWDPKSIASLNAAFTIDMGVLALALDCLPLHQKLALSLEVFSNEELEWMERRARYARERSAHLGVRRSGREQEQEQEQEEDEEVQEAVAGNTTCEKAGTQPELVFMLGSLPEAQQLPMEFERETQPEDVLQPKVEPPQQPQVKVDLQQQPPPEVEPPQPLQPKVEPQQPMQSEVVRESEQPCPESTISPECSADEVSAAAQAKKKSRRNKKRASGQEEGVGGKEAGKEAGKEGGEEGRGEKPGKAQPLSAPSMLEGKKEDDHLDFLLSLQKPSTGPPQSLASAFAAPTSALQAAIDQEEPLPPPPALATSAQPQVEKTHDLEDWLDSMLDD